MKATCLVAALALTGAWACGGRSLAGSGALDGGAAPPDGSIEAGALPDAGGDGGLPTYLAVPEGDVYVGGFEFDPVTKSFAPNLGCDGPDAGAVRFPAKKLHVGAFNLMTTAVTNAAYAPCVQQGVCAAPVPAPDAPGGVTIPWTFQGAQNLPANVAYDQASTYCAWLGARLPTLAELARAAQADSQTPGVPAMTSLVVTCPPIVTSDQPCNQLGYGGSDAGLAVGRGLDPVTTRNPTSVVDIGPFGHLGLFGNGAEWTETTIDYVKLCSLPEGSPDFVTFGDAGSSSHVVLDYEDTIVPAVQDAFYFDQTELVAVGNAPDGVLHYNQVFRCVSASGT